MDQTKYIVTMAKEGSTQIVHFMTPGAGVLVLGRGYKSYSENASSAVSRYNTLIATICCFPMLLVFFKIFFYLFYDGHLIGNYEPSDKKAV